MEFSRIGYNTTGWRYPKGDAGPHETGLSFNRDFGFGFEDWLFRKEWQLDGYSYGHVHGVTRSRPRLLKENTPFDLIVYTKEPDGRRRYVALLRNVRCLSADDALEITEAYREAGWLELMRKEVAAAKGDVAKFDRVAGNHGVHNIRFRWDDVEFYRRDAYAAPGDPVNEIKQYQLANIETMYAKRGLTFELAALGKFESELSTVAFSRAFERFQSAEVAHAGKRLESFRDTSTLTHQWEAYKERLAVIAGERMEANAWRKRDVGSGQILDGVIAAIEHKENNLLRWQNRFGEAKREHAALIAARQDVEQRTAFESVFFDMYRQKKLGAAQFQALAESCRGSYALVAYLFFIADPERFLPIRPSRFDKVFESLGIELRTAGRCSWDNYHAYLAAIATVREQLLAYGIADTRLLDAHSFCWVLSTAKDVPQPMQRIITGQEFQGEMLAPKGADKAAPAEHAATVDLDGNHAARLQAGKCAEGIALEHERERLRRAGQPNLANAVEDVSNRPAYGYDIRSFETDGSERCIEVKNVSKSNRFILTDNEWQKSQGPQNYWFYLVSRADTSNPLVEYLCAHDVREKDLKPMQWEVKFRRSKSKK